MSPQFHHHPIVVPQLPTPLRFLLLRQLHVSQVDEGIDVAADGAFLVHLKPPEDAIEVELVLATELEVSLGRFGINQTDGAVEGGLGLLGLHTVLQPSWIQC